MTGTTTARNVTQRAGTILRVHDRIVNANNGIYVVPAKKEARVTDMLGNLNAVGGDAAYAIAVKRFSSGLFESITNFQIAGVDQKASAITLKAGDILTDIGNTGSTNGTFDLAATVEEFGI